MAERGKEKVNHFDTFLLVTDNREASEKSLNNKIMPAIEGLAKVELVTRQELTKRLEQGEPFSAVILDSLMISNWRDYFLTLSNKDLTILVTSDAANSEDSIYALSFGAFDYIDTSLPPDELRFRILGKDIKKS